MIFEETSPSLKKIKNKPRNNIKKESIISYQKQPSIVSNYLNRNRNYSKLE